MTAAHRRAPQTQQRSPDQLLKSIIAEISTQKLVFLIFSGKNCHACQQLYANLPWLKQRYGDRVYTVVVDVGRHHALAMSYGIMGIPTLFVFHDNQVLFKESGLQSKRELKTMVQNAESLVNPAKTSRWRLFG